MYECNAVIEHALLTRNDGDRCILGVWLSVNYGGSGQGFGGYALYLPKSFSHHKLESVAGHFLYRCMEIAEVDDWDKMKGRTIRVRKEDEFGRIVAIGHIVKNDWFDPKADFASIVKAEEAAI